MQRGEPDRETRNPENDDLVRSEQEQVLDRYMTSTRGVGPLGMGKPHSRVNLVDALFAVADAIGQLSNVMAGK